MDVCRSSCSAVEGRNGYLSRLHHSHRGFTEQTLKVLTVIHNFDLKRVTPLLLNVCLENFRICLTGLSSTWASYLDPGDATQKLHLQKPTRTSCPVAKFTAREQFR